MDRRVTSTGRGASGILTVPVRRFDSAAPIEFFEERQDLLAVEEPLQIQVANQDVSITMRTPGHDAELAVGFLFTEGIIQKAGDVAYIRCEENVANVTLADSAEPKLDDTRRNFYMTSSCGVCGKASIQALEQAGCAVLPQNTAMVAESVIRNLPATLRQSQDVFNRTAACGKSSQSIQVRTEAKTRRKSKSAEIVVGAVA